MSLQKIQSELKAPKGQTNKFGGYKYRSCEDILEAVKPVLAKYSYSIVIADDIIPVGDPVADCTMTDEGKLKSKTISGRVYVKATATMYDPDMKQVAQASAFAREDDSKKGMDLSQLTGSCSSYARKYALNGLLLIDDTKDSDTTNTHQ